MPYEYAPKPDFKGHWKVWKNSNEPMFLVFTTLSDETPFNTALRGLEAVEKFLEAFVTTEKLERDRKALSRVFDNWRKSATESEYSDFTYIFSNDAWVTVTYNESIQDLQRVPKTKPQLRKEAVHFSTGMPRYVRVYDYWKRRIQDAERPTTEYRYIIVFSNSNPLFWREYKGYPYYLVGQDPEKFWEKRITQGLTFVDELGRYKRINRQKGQGEVVIHYTEKQCYHPRLGKRIHFKQLPPKVKAFVIREYKKYWKIKDHATIRIRGDRKMEIMMRTRIIRARSLAKRVIKV